MSRTPQAPSQPPGVAAAVAYCHDVLSGQIPACRLVHLTCERFLRDLAAAQAGAGLWAFRSELAERAMIFAGLLPNIRGPEAGRPLRLMAWQRLVFANLFGFVERSTGARRFRQAIVFVPRGNGKTSIAAPLALYLSFMDGEGGAEGYAAAVTRDQARILFDTARQMVLRCPEIRRRYGVEALANSVWQERSSSHFRPVSSDAKALDGLNVQVAVCDEIASHRTSEVYDVLLTGMGKRRHPLLLCISTATGNNSGIGKQLWDYAARVLEGTQTDERVFALVYTLDPEDDPWTETSWVKANPGWGQTVQPDAIRAIMRQTRNNPAQEAAAKTRHLNIWVSADEALFSLRSWREAADTALSLDDFEGEGCYLGLDLASRTDLAALALVFPTRDIETGRTTYTAFARSYINEAAVLEARNPSYPGWAAEGYLMVTPGNETDFDVIETDVRELCSRFRVMSVGYDPWQSAQMSQRLRVEGVPMFEFRATTQNFSPAIVEIDAAMRAGRLRHDGNPVLEWCLGNVVGKADRRGNLYPTKQRSDQKIDAAVALMMAIGRAMSEEDPIAGLDGFLANPLMF
jgi:phage terminase large subunit-like protein